MTLFAILLSGWLLGTVVGIAAAMRGSPSPFALGVVVALGYNVLLGVIFYIYFAWHMWTLHAARGS